MLKFDLHLWRYSTQCFKVDIVRKYMNDKEVAIVKHTLYTAATPVYINKIRKLYVIV